MDTGFSIALHLLILISESETPLSSAAMAASVGTNPSFVRKILGALKRAGLITSRRGAAGFALVRPAADVTLLQVYKAVYGKGEVEIFPMHGNPNDECLVGRYIHPTLGEVFGAIRAEAERKMAATTVADCIADMRNRAKTDGAI